MPVISETKVIVEAVLDTYDRLHDAFGTQDGARDDGSDAAIRIEQL